MSSIVALDLETTGLNPKNDLIIEIGAVRFNENGVEAEWDTLVNPGRPIPPQITQLTGISNQMVMNAPFIQEVLPDFAAFVGDSPVLGHNIDFDLAFLNRHNILTRNEKIDTYEMASVLLPTASRYNLEALAQSLGFPPDEAHRALEDSRTCYQVYQYLYEKSFQLPIDLLAQFVRLSEPFNWGAGWVFRKILKARSREVLDQKSTAGPIESILASKETILEEPLIPLDTPVALDIEEMASLLEYAGPFAKYFKNFEHRPQQVEMTRAVSNALSNGLHLLVEAGTGTGKSFAYLAPAAIWAVKNHMRVVISTNTINLQDQLIKKDIPDLNNALGLGLRASVMKGRGNYLCPKRLEAIRKLGPENPDEMRILAKILVWLHEGGKGDRNELNLNGPVEKDIWSRISADDDNCRAEVCMSRMGGICPFYQARQAAESAHILIVNHALLLADISTGSRVLPEYQYLIIDEGHHIESAVTSALSYRFNQSQIGRLLKELGSESSGILGKLLTQLDEILKPSELAVAHQLIKRVTDLAFRLEHDFLDFFKTFDFFLTEMREGRPLSAYGQQQRILPATRTLPIWEEIEIVWDTLDETFRLLLNLIEQLYQSISSLEERLNDEVLDSLDNVASYHRSFNEIETQLSNLVSDPDANNIYWAGISPNNFQLSLEIAPLHIGELMQKYLWHEKTCIILTSATLTTNEGFDYIRSRLHAEDADELQLGSPFDYESSALLYLVNDIPEPTDKVNYQRGVERVLIQLSKATDGRLLALFTSYAQLKQTSQNIAPVLAKFGIEIFEQGKGASPNALLENFKSSEKAVLLGTRSFWEGVDIPGEDLSALVIIKLPFAVPSDPVIAARAETFEDPFNEYNLPEAILLFRQGFGRLIRTQYDRGIVAILDRRILTKRYGRAFLESLPPCTTKTGSIQQLPENAASWLNL